MSQQIINMNKAGKKSDNGEFSNRYVAQVFIFQGEDYLGWDCFYKDKITIGKSEDADVVLRDGTISDIQANIYFKGDQVIVSDQTGGRGVFVNNRACKTVILGPLDYVDIGSYTIKVKLRQNENQFSEIQKSGQSVDKEDTQTHLFQLNQPKDQKEVTSKSQYNDNADLTEEDTDQRSSIEWPDSQEIPKDPLKSNPGTSPQHDGTGDHQAETSHLPEDHYAHQKENSDGKDNIENIETQESGDITDRGQDIEKGRYRLVFEGKIKESLSLDDVKKRLSGLLKTSKSRIESLFSGKQVTIKKDTDYETAVKLKDSLEKAGVIAKVESFEETTPKPDIRVENEIQGVVDDKARDDLPEDDDTYEKTIDLAPELQTFSSVDIDEDDDEEEEDCEDINNLYFLKERMLEVNPVFKSSSEYRPIIEVLKYRNKVLIDVCFLNENEKYYVENGKDKFCLAEHGRKKTFNFYFSENYNGIVRTSGSTISETATMQSSERLFHAKKGIYKDTIPENGEVIISDGTFEYLLRQVPKEESIKIKELPPKERTFHKFLLKSVLIHFFLLIGFGLYTLIPDTSEPPPETHFVKIETDEILELKKKLTPPPKPQSKPKPKEKPKVVKVEPQKKTPVEKSKPKPQQVASAKPSKTRSKGKAGVSRHPDAGGGFGKGNVANRNINQAGLLSMIGDSVSLKPTSAMAAVTNLDAVSSARGSEGNFKVNGIVGKLGNAKIEIPKSGGIVSTKGSTQVLRSAGVGGKGRVAALEKGKTGQKQVMGMVTAKLTKTVSIRGGMSREAVKRVIDQHLDEISYCYETALIANPSIMGKVIFEWKILLSGGVGEIRIKSSSINNSEIHACIKSAIKTWQFPEPKGNEVIVSYPFIFDIVGF